MIIFFFKQKTAYEMRISDWSSDVCSSDLVLEVAGGDGPRVALVPRLGEMGDDVGLFQSRDGVQRHEPGIARADADADETGSVSHKPSLASALTAAAVIALPPIRPRATDRGGIGRAHV